MIAILRVDGPEIAIGTYLQSALGGRRALDYKKLMVEYPDLCKRAVATVFAYQRSIDGPTLNAFRKAKLDRMVLPTFRDIEAAWNTYQLERYEGSQAKAQRHTTEQPRDPRSFTDAEIAAARKEHYKSRRSS